MPDNNDPIQDYATSKISKLFEKNSLRGESEYKYEYYGEENIIEEYNENSRTYSIEYKKQFVVFATVMTFIITIFLIFIFFIFYVMADTTYEESNTKSLTVSERMEQLEQREKKIEEIENKYNKYDFSRMNRISFDAEVSIPTIYEYVDKDIDTIYEYYKYSDTRFGNDLSTVEVIYSGSFSDLEKLLYRQELEKEGYIQQLPQNFYEYTYVRDYEEKNIYIVICFGENNVIYGIGNGDSSNFYR